MAFSGLEKIDKFKNFDKRYLVFGYTDYEAGGGMNDFLFSVDNLENLKECFDNLEYRYDNKEIFDTKTGEYFSVKSDKKYYIQYYDASSDSKIKKYFNSENKRNDFCLKNNYKELGFDLTF